LPVKVVIRKNQPANLFADPNSLPRSQGGKMSLNPFKEKGIALEQQFRNRKQIAQLPYRKQKVDAYTRCRVILMNGIETESILFSHNFGV
jgi:energy-converting hydrogenase Eha subunit F